MMHNLLSSDQGDSVSSVQAAGLQIHNFTSYKSDRIVQIQLIFSYLFIIVSCFLTFVNSFVYILNFRAKIIVLSKLFCHYGSYLFTYFSCLFTYFSCVLRLLSAVCLHCYQLIVYIVISCLLTYLSSLFTLLSTVFSHLSVPLFTF